MKTYSGTPKHALQALLFGFAVATSCGSLCLNAAEDLAPLPIKLPTPTFRGTPPDMELGELIEKPTDKARAPPHEPVSNWMWQERA